MHSQGPTITGGWIDHMVILICSALHIASSLPVACLWNSAKLSCIWGEDKSYVCYYIFHTGLWKLEGDSLSEELAFVTALWCWLISTEGSNFPNSWVVSSISALIPKLNIFCLHHEIEVSKSNCFHSSIKVAKLLTALLRQILLFFQKVEINCRCQQTQKFNACFISEFTCLYCLVKMFKSRRKNSNWQIIKKWRLWESNNLKTHPV